MIPEMDDTSTSTGGMFFLFFTLLWLAMMAVTTSFGGGANTGEQSEGDDGEGESNNIDRARTSGRLTCWKLYCANIYGCICTKGQEKNIWRTWLFKLVFMFLTTTASAVASIVITDFFADEDQSIKETVNQVLEFVFGDEATENTDDFLPRSKRSASRETNIHIMAVLYTMASVAIVWTAALLTVFYFYHRKTPFCREQQQNVRMDNSLSQEELGLLMDNSFSQEELGLLMKTENIEGLRGSTSEERLTFEGELQEMDSGRNVKKLEAGNVQRFETQQAITLATVQEEQERKNESGLVTNVENQLDERDD